MGQKLLQPVGQNHTKSVSETSQLVSRHQQNQTFHSHSICKRKPACIHGTVCRPVSFTKKRSNRQKLQSMLHLICFIMFVFGMSFGKAQRAERCGASVKRCNTAKRRQKQTLRAGTAFRPAASKPLNVAPLRPAALSLPGRRLSPAKWSRLNATCFRF